MKIEEEMKVRIKSSNDMLKAYEKAKTPFIVDSVFGEGNEAFVTLRFAETGEKLRVAIRGYEVIPYVL